MPLFRAPELTEFASRLFIAAGVPGDEAQTVAASLVGANLRGHDSHGVMRVPQYVDFVEKGIYRTGVALKVEHETPAVVDLRRPVGLRPGPGAPAAGPDPPQGPGAGAVGRRSAALRAHRPARRVCRARGRGGPDPDRHGQQRRLRPSRRASRRDRARGSAPTPSARRCRRPAIPVVLDFGTSVVAEGKVRVYHINKRPVPEGWLLDPQGSPTTDPSVLYNTPLGSILPMGGAQAYKGFGLGLVLDMLSGGLTGGRSSFRRRPAGPGEQRPLPGPRPRPLRRPRRPAPRVDPARRVRPRDPRARASARSSCPATPSRTLRKRSAEGIPLEDAHWAKLSELAERLGVAVPGNR